MRFYLGTDVVLKWIEIPSVYHLTHDNLFELDEESFAVLKQCSSPAGCEPGDREFIDYCLKEEILTKKKVTLKRPLLKKAAAPSLRYLELQITDACNLRCKHCYTDAKHHSELSVSRIRDILREFEEMQGLRILITGGEPLLHREFYEINSMLPEFFLRKLLFTNGSLLKKETLRKLNVHEIQISIDGLEDAHDALRGKGTFRITMDAVRRSQDAGFEVSVSTMVHPRNLGDFDEMDSLFKGLGIRDWTVDVPCVAGRLRDNIAFQITPQQAGKYLGYGYGGGLHSGAEGYACGLHLMSVMADGRVSKCTFFGDTAVGSIEEGLRTCWERIRPVRLEELACDCEHRESCRGGCRYRAGLLGNLLGKDLYRCALYNASSCMK